MTARHWGTDDESINKSLLSFSIKKTPSSHKVGVSCPHQECVSKYKTSQGKFVFEGFEWSYDNPIIKPKLCIGSEKSGYRCDNIYDFIYTVRDLYGKYSSGDFGYGTYLSYTVGESGVLDNDRVVIFMDGDFQISQHESDLIADINRSYQQTKQRSFNVGERNSWIKRFDGYWERVFRRLSRDVVQCDGGTNVFVTGMKNKDNLSFRKVVKSLVPLLFGDECVVHFE